MLFLLSRFTIDQGSGEILRCLALALIAHILCRGLDTSQLIAGNYLRLKVFSCADLPGFLVTNYSLGAFAAFWAFILPG